MKILVIAFILSVVVAASTEKEKPKLLYILIDGFRYDYLDAQPVPSLPNFNDFLKKGVKAEWMSPIFPSISYPDWTTLVTGLWAESHGIVGNFFYDPSEKDSFFLGKRKETGKKKWWTAEPIWITSTKNGVKTGVVRFSRCDIEYDGLLPDYCLPFDMKEQSPESFRVNAENAVNLLENDYDFVLLYTPFIDTAGHYYGPDSDKTKIDIQKADNVLGYIMKSLRIKNLLDKVNIVIVSDHGMKNVAPPHLKHVQIDDYVDLNNIESISETGAFANIKVIPGKVDEVYEQLKRVPGINVYRKNEIPESLHYKHGKYVHEIVIVADSKTFIAQSRSSKQIPPYRSTDKELIGAHGFDPREEEMRTIFFARGPNFYSNKVISAIQNVDVYPLIARLIGVPALPHNGTVQSFTEATNLNIESSSTISQISVFTLLISLIVLTYTF